MRQVEERAYGKALQALMGHVAACDACLPRAVCFHGKVQPRVRPADSCVCCGTSAATATGRCQDCAELIAHQHTAAEQAACPSCRPQADLDLSDPAAPLCPAGVELRDAATRARAQTPPERLVAFWGLEEDDIPAQDEHDAARAAAWLREDPGQARVFLTRLEERGPLEERDSPVEARREEFLKTYRELSPSRGAPPSPEQRAVIAAAADRLCALVAERYAHRHGEPPPPEALEAYRRRYDLWLTESGDLAAIAADAAAYKASHEKRWRQRALLKPKDPLHELKKIADSIAEAIVQEKAALG